MKERHSARYRKLQHDCYEQPYRTEIEIKQRKAHLRAMLKRDLFFWLTKDHRIVPMVLMRESHIRNAWRSIYREILPICNKQWFHVTKEEWELLNGRYRALSRFQAELRRRRLVTPSIPQCLIEKLRQEPDYDDDPYGLGNGGADIGDLL